ncbi:hypothetical protein NOCA280089 [metagenome]|uniref:Uncharacterized protein n=1 Tax=metagenome TaxID=256318 RepID=A0A2P2CFC1_9ZZZZ
MTVTRGQRPPGTASRSPPTDGILGQSTFVRRVPSTTQKFFSISTSFRVMTSEVARFIGVRPPYRGVWALTTWGHRGGRSGVGSRSVHQVGALFPCPPACALT